MVRIALIASAQVAGRARGIRDGLASVGYVVDFGLWDVEDPRFQVPCDGAECVALVGNPMPVVDGESLGALLANQGFHVASLLIAGDSHAGGAAPWAETLGRRPAAAPPGSCQFVQVDEDLHVQAMLVAQVLESALAAREKYPDAA